MDVGAASASRPVTSVERQRVRGQWLHLWRNFGASAADLPEMQPECGREDVIERAERGMMKSALSKERAEAVTQRSVLGDGSTCYRTSKFTQVVTRLAPGYVLVTGIGYNSGECAPLITADVGRSITQVGKLTTFVNLAAQTGQASIAREWWADWAKQNRPQLEVTHMLVRTRMMDMAISVLGMVIGGGMIKAHSDVAEFEAVIASLVPSFRRLPAFADLPPMLA